MTRSLTGTFLRNAIDVDGSYYMLAKADFYPSRVFFATVTSDHPVAGSDAIGIVDDPMKQDIVYSSVSDALVTFWATSGDESPGVLQYAVQGSNTITQISLAAGHYAQQVKPGVLGSILYYYDETNCIRRMAVDWTDIDARSNSPLTLEVTSDPILNVVAVHAISDTQAVAIVNDDGGFRVVYLIGDTPIESKFRFMFPSMMPYDLSTLTMAQQGIASGAARLGNNIYAYITNASSGMVEGMYYNLDNGAWSDIFTVLPTDLDVSLCSFKIANVYAHNGTIYMCGQFVRTDAMDASQPYSLLLYSTDGRTFAIDRFTLVSNIGYRFLAHVGSDDNLYLGNCNRVCYDEVTWVFDGATGTAGKVLHLTETHIKEINDHDLAGVSITLRAGKEEYFDSDCVVDEARVVLWLGMKTADPGAPTVERNDYVKYGTYIIDSIGYNLATGGRGTQVQAVGEAQWKLGGMSMPFYAEITGKSVHFDPLLLDSTELSPAGNVYFWSDKFSVDMWSHIGYESDQTAPHDVAPIDMHEMGGIKYYESSGDHTLGIIMDQEIQTVLALGENPKITNTQIEVDVYGWSHAMGGGEDNDNLSLVLITEDVNGIETEHYPGSTGMPPIESDIHWTQSYPDTISDADHITPAHFTLTAMTVGDKIKRVGVVFNGLTTTQFNIARLEFTSGVSAKYIYYNGDSTWTMNNGVWKVPHSGRPFIMYAQRPYNMRTFSVTAAFNNAVDSGDCVANYPCAVGMVGFGLDNDNYIVGRINKTTEDAELLVCVDGVETLLANAHVGIPNHIVMRMDYKGGCFSILLWDPYLFCMDEVLSYEWEAADGVMFSSRDEAMKCGIYGFKGAPYARTLGYYTGESEGVTNADGLPIDPLFDIDDFPASGNLRIGDDVYSYTSKIAMPGAGLARGPYQYRTDSDAYTDPIAGAALECQDFYWLGGQNAYDGFLVAIDDGSNFVISDTVWQVPNGGSYFYSRTRFYSANTQIGLGSHVLSNKVWVTGGFAGLVQVNGTTVVSRHAEGEMVNYEMAGDILCYWYMGAGGEDDTVVEDMISRVCKLSGVTPVFPGDTIISSINADDSDVITIPYAEGLDIRFEHGYDGEIDLLTNIKISPDNEYSYNTHQSVRAAILNDTDMILKIYTDHSSGGYCDYYFAIYSEPSDTLMWCTIYNAPEILNTFRIVYFANNISIYMNDQWITTKAFDGLVYEDSLTLGIDVIGISFALYNILIKEMSDWREAIFIDLETDGQSAIGSIIQQRYVETVNLSDGSIEFFYDIIRDQLTATRIPRSHKYTREVPINGASDAIIYGPLEVRTMQNADFARELGLSTKLMRMPDLTSGATRAVKLILQKEYESRIKHEMIMRPDLALMVGDIYVVAYNASGTGRAESHSIIVESIAFTMRMSGPRFSSSMTVTRERIL